MSEKNKKNKKLIIIIIAIIVITVIAITAILLARKNPSEDVLNPQKNPNAFNDTTKNNISKPIVTYNETILFLDDNKTDEQIFADQPPEVILNDNKIKERYNKKYNVYLNGKKIAKADGVISRNNGGTYIILIEWENNDQLKQYDRYEYLGKFAYVSDEYDALKRDYTYYDSDNVISIVDDSLKNSLIELMKAKEINVNTDTFNMYEMYITDLDGDGKKEKIVNVNNFINTPKPLISGEVMYYSYIAILSDDNKLKKEIQVRADVEVVGENPSYPDITNNLSKTIPMLLDINNDNKIDLYIKDSANNIEVIKY